MKDAVKHLIIKPFDLLNTIPLARTKTCYKPVKCGTHLGINVIKMLKKISLVLLTKWKHNFKNAEALLSLLGPCSKNEKLLVFLR